MAGGRVLAKDRIVILKSSDCPQMGDLELVSA